MSDYKPPMCCGKEMDEESTGAEYSTEKWLWCDVCDSTTDIPDEYYEWKYEGIEEWYRQNQIEERRIEYLKNQQPLKIRIEFSKHETEVDWNQKQFIQSYGEAFVYDVASSLEILFPTNNKNNRFMAIAGSAYEEAKAMV